MFEFVEDLFTDWTPTAIAVWALLSIGLTYIVWFVDLPALSGNTSGFPIEIKFAVPIIIPLVTWYFIQNKEWTADKFNRRRK